jgi:hypothetical protein
LVLPMPDFTEDLAALLYPPLRLTPEGFDSTKGFWLRLDSETGGRYVIQESTNLVEWASFLTVTNTTGTLLLSPPPTVTNARSFFRATKAD